MTEWPSEYDTTNHPANPGRPHWSKTQARQAGRALAIRMFNDRAIADSYLSIVKEYYADRGEHVIEYLGLIGTVIRDADLGFDTTSCNANDFANCHRAAWIYLANSFAYLVDKCPHVVGGKSDWGNPPHYDTPTPHFGISRGDDDLVATPLALGAPLAGPWFFVVHNIPNLSGFFAISTDDVTPAPVNR